MFDDYEQKQKHEQKIIHLGWLGEAICKIEPLVIANPNFGVAVSNTWENWE